ncbi:MAG TPA: hypothetical protein ENI23_16880 [bacterium]|nr:hypothetical protein [bacterium]
MAAKVYDFFTGLEIIKEKITVMQVGPNEYKTTIGRFVLQKAPIEIIDLKYIVTNQGVELTSSG